MAQATTDGGVGALEGAVALVTGGTRGIGLEVARGLGRAGATVVLVGRDPARVEQAVADLLEEEVDATGAPSTSRTRRRAAARRAARTAGRGRRARERRGRHERAHRQDAADLPEEWRRVLGTNLDGVFAMTAAFVPGMVERRRGRVVNLSACLGRMSGPGTRAASRRTGCRRRR
jgi:NAD(P)-dependent dehydrogenase (short-subunit alcohol dehydrogenase family)